MHWTVHIEGGPRRVNHAAVTVGQLIYSFGGYCTGDNYSVQRDIDIHVLNPGSFLYIIFTYPVQFYNLNFISYILFVILCFVLRIH